MAEDTTPARAPTVVSAAAVVVILAAMHAAATLIVPVAIAFIVTVLAAPLQRRLTHVGWHRIAAFLVVLAATMTALAAVFWIVDLSLSAFVADLPSYRPGGVQLLTDLLSLGKSLHVDLTHLVRAAAVVQSAFAQADTLTRAFLSSIAGWAVVLTLTGFMLFEALDYPEKARVLLGNGTQFRRVVRFTDDLSRFMGILTLGAMLTATGDLIVLIALGIPSALLWSTLAFFLSYIPSVGSFIIVVPPTIATLVRFGFGRAMLVLTLMLLVDNVVGVVVVPRLLGRRVSIAPFWGMLSLVFWGWLLGPAGAILAVPLTMLAKFMLEGSSATEWLGRLMSPLQPRERAPAG